MELGRERLDPLRRPAQDAQAGSPGQIVFSGRIVLQNPRQGTPCVSAGGCRTSIERRRPPTPGRTQLPLVISQQVASPRGEVEVKGMELPAIPAICSRTNQKSSPLGKPLLNTPGTFSQQNHLGRTDLPVRPRRISASRISFVTRIRSRNSPDRTPASPARVQDATDKS